MTQPCMLAYSQLLIKTCHKRGIHAMGGMAAQIPIKNDDAANNAALKKVALKAIHLVPPYMIQNWLQNCFHPSKILTPTNFTDNIHKFWLVQSI